MKLHHFMAGTMLGLLAIPAVQAGIYKWTDSSGKIHFADDRTTTNSEAKSDIKAETVDIKDKYIIPNIEKEKPLPYPFDKPNRPVALSTVLLELTDSEKGRVRIGRVTCGQPIDIYWTDGFLDLKGKGTGEQLTKVFNDAGYVAENSTGQPASPGSLTLEAKITNMKINVCAPQENDEFTQNASFVEVLWTLRDPIYDTVLYTGTTKGSHNAQDLAPVIDGTQKSVTEAFSNAITTLLAKREFTDQLKPIDMLSLAKKFSDDISVELKPGDGKGSFLDSAEQLKNNSVIIKTEKGHGSGVIINKQGYILTNAHVVGKEKAFTVISTKYEYKAELVREEEIRDVALLKIKDYDGRLTGVPVSHERPKVGSGIFVIGTPLKVEFSHTVTKGIVSAERDIQGLPYLQTDAAINFGNSGGPVFNEQGDLIGLTVSGVFTNQGTSLNINYFIPIHDAFKSLKLTNGSTQSGWSILTSGSSGGSQADRLASIVDMVYNWLNEPVVSP